MEAMTEDRHVKVKVMRSFLYKPASFAAMSGETARLNVSGMSPIFLA